MCCVIASGLLGSMFEEANKSVTFSPLMNSKYVFGALRGREITNKGDDGCGIRKGSISRNELIVDSGWLRIGIGIVLESVKIGK